MKMKPSQMTIHLWGHTLKRGKDRCSDQWWLSKVMSVGAPAVEVSHYSWHLKAPGVWGIHIYGPGGVVARCSGPTFEGCVDHLTATGVPQKWFYKKAKNP